jgi:hypothetical protein
MNAQQTRLESYITRPQKTRKQQILEILGDREMTARMILKRMKHSDMNFVRPRLTEMVKDGILEICGSAFDKETDKNTVIYRRKK